MKDTENPTMPPRCSTSPAFNGRPRPARGESRGQPLSLIWQWVVLLVLSAAIVLTGCSDDDDNVEPQDVANRTFIFDSSFIDNDLEGLTSCLAFQSQSATDDTLVPFTLTLQDTVTLQDAEPCPGQAVATLSGPATVGSIELRIDAITDGNGNSVNSIVIFDEVTFEVGDTFDFDVHVDEEDDGTLEFTFANNSGNDLLFRFKIGETSAAASPQ